MFMQHAILFLVLLAPAPTLWAEVRASLDSNSIYDGDTVMLTIEANGKDMGVEPDLSVLEKDFAVLGTSSSRRLQFINGKRSDQHQWQIELDPLRKGTLTVPAIPVGKSATSPLSLKVSEQPDVQGTGADQPVFIKNGVDDKSSSPFVQQQIHYTVRMYYRVPLVEGRFSNLEITDALVERLGEDRQYQSMVNGKRYQVLERHYAIFAEKSGQLTIPATAFTGRIMSRTGRSSNSSQMDSMMEHFFGSNNSFNAGKRVRVRSQALTLDVKPRPADYKTEHWLPGAGLELQDSWTEDTPEFRVGEPVTRTITLLAKGLESSHLPDVSIPETDNMRLYPEQAVTENRTDGEWVFGTRKQSIAYVPSRSGRVSLPEIRIDWWDTTQQRQRSTVLPSWDINVLPAAGDVAEHAVPEAQTQQDEIETGDTDVGATASSLWEVIRSRRLLLAGALFALLAALLLLYRKHLQSKSAPPQTKVAKQGTFGRPTANHARRELQKACEENSPQAAAQALLNWAADEWPDQPPRNLGALAHRVDKGGDEIHELDTVLYGNETSSWSGQALWDRFRQGLHDGKTTETSSPTDSLSPLYPRWG